MRTITFMKNYPAYMLSVALLAALVFGFSSCKEDEPAVPPKLSFSSATMTVTEGDGVIEVPLNLDKPYGKKLTIEYTLGGTAKDQDAVGTADADYKVVGDHGVVVIESGTTSGVIKLELYDDAIFEADETIEISILDTNTSDVEIGDNDDIEITITNDDAQLAASFNVTTMTVDEDDAFDVDGTGNPVATPVKVAVQLDKTAPVDITVEYEIFIDLKSQTRKDAIDSTFGYNNNVSPQYYDYYINGTTDYEDGSADGQGKTIGQLTIPAGSSTADIEIQLYTDFQFEDDETIELKLRPTAQVQVGTNQTVAITLEQQNGKVIALVWPKAYPDVDMDMFLWTGDDTTNLDFLLDWSIRADTVNRLELLMIPDVLANGAFGMSYIYYSGTADPMNFEAHFIDFVDGVVEDEANIDIFAGTYSLANINPWDSEATGTFPPLIVHRFVATDGVYAYGKIQTPVSGSRLRRSSPPEKMRRMRTLPSRKLNLR